VTNTLEAVPQAEREIVFTRNFDASRERVGGAARFVWHHRDGKNMGMSGVYREIAPPERLVFTELGDEDWTGGEAVVTMALAEQAGKTTLAMTVLYASRAARDAVLKTPMEQGMAQSYNRLDELLAATPAEAEAEQ
jgi:uncharacterized protein YndB with AHSA1/START domain